MPIKTLIGSLILTLLLVGCNGDPDSESKSGQPTVDKEKIQTRAREAARFCKQKNFNTDFCILIDMSLHSGVKRFFVWDFATRSITRSYLVGHGCGSNAWSSDQSKATPRFSNQDGSHCSSLGKYRIGARGYSNWGIHVKYLLHGLDATNSNALSRFIVFHSWEKMADREVYPAGSPEGWGCPTVSDNAMRAIDPLLRQSSKPVLMWVYI